MANNLYQLSSRNDYSIIISGKSSLIDHEAGIAEMLQTVNVGGPINGAEAFLSDEPRKNDSVNFNFDDLRQLKSEVRNNVRQTEILISNIKTKTNEDSEMIETNNTRITELLQIPSKIYEAPKENSVGEEVTPQMIYNPAYIKAQEEITELRQANKELDSDITILDVEKQDLSNNLEKKDNVLDNVERIIAAYEELTGYSSELFDEELTDYDETSNTNEDEIISNPEQSNESDSTVPQPQLSPVQNYDYNSFLNDSAIKQQLETLQLQQTQPQTIIEQGMDQNRWKILQDTQNKINEIEQNNEDGIPNVMPNSGTTGGGNGNMAPIKIVPQNGVRYGGGGALDTTTFWTGNGALGNEAGSTSAGSDTELFGNGGIHNPIVEENLYDRNEEIKNGFYRVNIK